MEKPVRIVGNEKIRSFNEKVRNGLEHALNFMLGTDEANRVTIGAFEPFLMPIEAYIGAYKKKSILVKIHADKAYQGELYWFFEMATAVVLGGMLRMLPTAALAEKVAKGEFDATDQDAFGEVGNQLSGILDRAFRTLTHKNIHLKMDFNKKVYPDESIKLETFLNKEEYVVLLCDVALPAYGKQKLTLLLPRSLYEVLLNIEIQLEGISPKILLVHSFDPDRLEKIQARLNSRYVKVIGVPKPEDVLEKIEMPGVAAVGFDLKAIPFPLSHTDAILYKRLVANRYLMRMPYFLTWDGATDEGVKEFAKMGLTGATKSGFLAAFPDWAAPITQDPSYVP
jgi:hypothetical protein